MCDALKLKLPTAQTCKLADVQFVIMRSANKAFLQPSLLYKFLYEGGVYTRYKKIEVLNFT